MQKEHIRRATTKNARAGIFWHFQSAPVPLQHIEDFASVLKNHLENFQSKDFTAVATSAYTNNNDPVLKERMHNANIDLIDKNSEKQVIETIQDKMSDFYDKHHKDSCWMVLITGSYEFYRIIDHYKHKKSFDDLVLVHNSLPSMNKQLSKDEIDQIRLVEDAPKKSPLSYFLGLITSKTAPVEETDLQINQRVFSPPASDVPMDWTAEPNENIKQHI